MPFMSSHAMKPERRSAFTIIEVMVTISIIALLLALLLPVLQTAVRTAQRVECLANLDGLFMASYNYAQDNELTLPDRLDFEDRFMPSGEVNQKFLVMGTQYFSDEYFVQPLRDYGLLAGTQLQCPAEERKPEFVFDLDRWADFAINREDADNDRYWRSDYRYLADWYGLVQGTTPYSMQHPPFDNVTINTDEDVNVTPVRYLDASTSSPDQILFAGVAQSKIGSPEVWYHHGADRRPQGFEDMRRDIEGVPRLHLDGSGKFVPLSEMGPAGRAVKDETVDFRYQDRNKWYVWF